MHNQVTIAKDNAKFAISSPGIPTEEVVGIDHALAIAKAILLSVNTLRADSEVPIPLV